MNNNNDNSNMNTANISYQHYTYYSLQLVKGQEVISRKSDNLQKLNIINLNYNILFIIRGRSYSQIFHTD